MALQDIALQFGKRVDPSYSKILTNRLAELLNTKKGFPATEAVPFEERHFELIETEDYFVCEKSPNEKRCLLFFFHSTKGPSSFLLDKGQEWYFIPNLVFPVRTKENEYLKDTILDGELVLNKGSWLYRVFDMMVINGSVITQRSFNSRLGMLQQDVIQPFQSRSRKEQPPINVELKRMERAYGLHLVFDQISTEHNIVFTPVKHPYTLGPSEKLLVWKSPESNTAFLRIVAKWSIDHKPIYSLEVTQGVTYKFYDHFKPETGLALKWRDQLPMDRIAKFRYDPEWDVTIVEQGYAPTVRKGGWRFVCFCDGNTAANNEETVNKILNNTRHGITKEQLVSHIDRIRTGWKAREKGLPMPFTAPIEKSSQQHGITNDAILDSPVSLSPSNSSRPSSLSEQGENMITFPEEVSTKMETTVKNIEPLKKRKVTEEEEEEVKEEDDEPMGSFSEYCSISDPIPTCKTKIPVKDTSILESSVFPMVYNNSTSTKSTSDKFHNNNNNDTNVYTTSPPPPPPTPYVYNNSNINLQQPVNTNSTPTTSFTSHLQYKRPSFRVVQTSSESNPYYSSKVERPQPKRSKSCTSSNIKNLLTTNKEPSAYRSLQPVKESPPAPLQFINYHAERHNPEEHVLIIRSESQSTQYTSAPVELSYPVNICHLPQHKKKPKSVKSKLDFILN